MKHLRYLLLAALLLPLAPLSGQDPPDAVGEIEGMGYGAIAGYDHDCPITANGRINGYVGAEFTCQIWAVDSTSALTPSTITATPDDDTRVFVSVTQNPPDSLGNYQPSTMLIRILRRGNWKITIEVRPILFIMGYMYNRPGPDDPVRTEGSGNIWPQIEYGSEIKTVVGEEFALCAYTGGYGEMATGKSYNRNPTCPDLGGVPLPEFEVTWVLPDILARMSPNEVRLATLKPGVVQMKGQRFRPIPWVNATQ